MLDEATIQRVGKHELMHTMGLCTCPCWQALIDVGEAIKRENELRVQFAKVAPDALIALTLGAAAMDDDDDVQHEEVQP
ncbi:MAG: hypothetical protein ACOYB2_11025 [Limnohabitans sp.]